MIEATNSACSDNPFVAGGYANFGLTLVLTSNCNLRCTYCYAGSKRQCVMPVELARKSIGRAINSLSAGGKLELGFFGGEPLIEAGLLLELADFAREQTRQAGKSLSMQVTTNGTIDTPQAWQVMQAGDIELAISCDGVEQAHDRHRRTLTGEGSLTKVLATLQTLLTGGKDVVVVSVVRPDTAEHLPASLEMFRRLGVKFVSPSLDLWMQWSTQDIDALSRVMPKCADIWHESHGAFGVGWFDDMAARLAKLEIAGCARCAFGAGQIAVTPSGNLYPCERLVGDDADDNPQRMAGHATLGDDFLGYAPPPARSLPACESCSIRHACSTFCRCSNYVRTGDPARPDGLLCQLNQMCFAEVTRVLQCDAE
ncbi:MAG: radical SAM protein [Planctomycetaceae bacterium]|nr:MAG: radical SAM protein [Planctomycetaceae bacterium]